MNILITGIAGFIGSHIAEELLLDSKINNIIGIDNFYSGKKENLDYLKSKDIDNKIIFYEENIINIDKINTIFTKYKIDYVFHEAAIASVQKSIENPLFTNEVNIKGTLNMLEVSKNNNVKRFVFASSAAIYGQEKTLPKNENSKIEPLSPYGYEKLMGEYYLKLYSDLYDLNTTALRYFNVFGERQDPSSDYSGVISIFDERIKNNQEISIFGDGEQYRDFIYVKDVVKANIEAMKEKTKGFVVYCVGTSKKTSLNELVKAMEEKYNKKIYPIYKEERVGDIKESICDNKKIIENLNLKINESFKNNLKKF